MIRIFRVVLSVLIAAADSGSACRAAGIHHAALDINIASAAALTAADTRTESAAGRKNLTAIDIRRQRAEMKVHAVSLREILDSDL